MFRFVHYGLQSLRLIFTTIMIMAVNAITPALRKGTVCLLIIAIISMLFTPADTLTALSLANLQALGRVLVVGVFGVAYLFELSVAINTSTFNNDMASLIKRYRQDKQHTIESPAPPSAS
ncbi:hypothetical protein VXS04_18525 [Photobacterium piscicola]|uniref:hypothetical protein n=1 Tax=Photobacterium piscicola TaxID=1378299 RepID=UPI002E18AA4A|nr:hypothetical protein [Photobacterium piscicola]